MQSFGIDISKWQGDYNLAQAKKEGVTFVIIKAGGSDSSSGRYVDSQFENNYKKCKELGLPCGAYYFGGDKTLDEAKASADHFLRLLKDKQFEYPVYYDVEADMLALDKTLLNQIVDKFCSTVQSAGYYTGIYASASPFSTHLTDSKFTHWVACYGKNKPKTRNCDIWQFGGKDNFIRSNVVAGKVTDQDYCYVDYPNLIKQKGLNGFNKSNNDTTPNNVTPTPIPPSNGAVMTSQQYVTKLVEIVNMSTVYSNKYPRNLGYWDGNKFSFDCWNLIKAVINGWYPNRTVGYYQKDLSITGDIDGANILKKCTKQSQDFTQLNIPGSYLFMRNTHAGTYVGEFTIAGNVYNVIECTAAWDKKVLWSYVDTNGNRCKYKGASPIGKWTDWGLMCWIDYSNATPQPLPPIPKVQAAKPTLRQGMHGEQVRLLQSQLISLGFSCGKWGADGDFGSATYMAVKKFQMSQYGFPNDKNEWDGEYGKKTAEKLQKALN